MKFSTSLLAPAAGLGLALLSAAWPATAQVAAAAAFTTEQQLGQPQVATAIEKFFETTGQAGDFIGQGGVRIAFRRFVQADRSAEKGAIVIVSGRTESLLKYKELVHDLWRGGYSVYIHDHRGQGLSEREAAVRDTPQKGYVGDFQHYVDDLRQFVGSEVAAGQHRRHYLLAHSMGGAVAALFLEERSPEAQRFQAAVLSSPMLEIRGIGGLGAEAVSCRVARLQVAAGDASDYIVSGGGYAAKSFEDNEYTHSLVRYKRLLAEVGGTPGIALGSPTHGWFAQACSASEKARTQAALVRTPVLVLVAGEDSIVHPDGPATFCRGLSGDVRAKGCDGRGGGPVTIPGARHELFIEQDAQRAQALQQVVQFFDSNR
ncbi:MAG TPA: alpha/beta fold hydrolase [Ideonella sp.]|nr:alpha/beta fold hydrolase [Ideonella sp.]